MTTKPEPPPAVVRDAVAYAMKSPCRSKRGAAVFMSHWLALGFNHKPKGFECDGSEACKKTCRVEAVHAEMMALGRVGRLSEHAQLLHVKVVDGQLVPSGPPNCVECSKHALDSGITAVWLYHEDGWRRYDTAEFHRLSLENRP